MAAPTAPELDIDLDVVRRLLPPYRVVLHNDDHNSMDHVIRALTKAVPSLTVERAVEIMMEAHTQGQATVIVCAKEAAEYYRERIETFGLTATIEPA